MTNIKNWRKQFELKQSWKALRAPNAHWSLTVYTVFEDKKSKWAKRKTGQAKNRINKDHRTNIIANNFFWEQLKMTAIKLKVHYYIKKKINITRYNQDHRDDF